MSQVKSVSAFSIENILQKQAGKLASNPHSRSPPIKSAESGMSVVDGSRFKFDSRLATLQLVGQANCASFLVPFVGQTPAKMHGPFSPSTPVQPSPGPPATAGICLQPLAAGYGPGPCRPDHRAILSAAYPLAPPSAGLTASRRYSDDSPMHSPDLPSDRKRKKKRTAFSSQQLKRLEDKFCNQKYLSKVDRTELAIALGLSERHVKTWYQNRRTKWKKECCESDWSKQREAAAAIMYMQHLDMSTKKPSTDSSSDDATN